ncbi:MAG: hypothetical protein AAF368_07505 [Planctomycetota bacterium]
MLLGLALTSCATTSAPPLPALTMLSVEPVDYDYNLGGPAPFLDWTMPQDYLEQDFEGPLVKIDAYLFEVDRVSSDELDPERPLSSAFVTTRADAERFMNESKTSSQATLVNHQTLVAHEEQPANVSVINQTAFISNFEVEQGNYSMVADPVVDVLTEGAVLCLLAPSVSSDSVHLEATLHTCQADKPFPEVQSRILAGTSLVTIQRPLVTSQELSFDAELSPDQTLVVKCESPNSRDSRLLVFLSASPVNSSQATN